MKNLKGTLREELFDWPDQQCPTPAAAAAIASKEMSPVSQKTLHQGEVAYIHDKIGLHRIGNPSKRTFAASLHLYAPPFTACQTFDQTTSSKRASGQCLFYSHQGKKLGHEAAVRLCREIMVMKEEIDHSVSSEGEDEGETGKRVF